MMRDAIKSEEWPYDTFQKTGLNFAKLVLY